MLFTQRAGRTDVQHAANVQDVPLGNFQHWATFLMESGGFPCRQDMFTVYMFTVNTISFAFLNFVFMGKCFSAK